jgi:hypothetical protein
LRWSGDYEYSESLEGTSYVSAISFFMPRPKRLSHEAEVELARAGKLDQIISANLSLVEFLLADHFNIYAPRTGAGEARLERPWRDAVKGTIYHVPYEDLVQEGRVGLCEAARRWDFERRIRYSTYARWWIIKRISAALADQDKQNRLPFVNEEFDEAIFEQYPDYPHHKHSRVLNGNDEKNVDY